MRPPNRDVKEQGGYRAGSSEQRPLAYISVLSGMKMGFQTEGVSGR